MIKPWNFNVNLRIYLKFPMIYYLFSDNRDNKNCMHEVNNEVIITSAEPSSVFFRVIELFFCHVLIFTLFWN